MIREILEEQRDRIIDDTRLADMSNSQLNAVADGLAKMIDLACDEHESAPPGAIINVAPLDIIDQRLALAFANHREAVANTVRRTMTLKGAKPSPKKVTPKKRTAKKTSKKR